MLIRKLSLGVPVNKNLKDIRSSNVESNSLKRIHLIEKKTYLISKEIIIYHTLPKDTKMMQ